MAPCDPLRPRRLGFAASVALGLLLTSIAVGFSAHPASAVPPESRGSVAPADQGALELAAARQSVPALAPHTPHPGLLPPLLSPGGFQWVDLTDRLTVTPSPREGPAMTWDPADGYVLLYGGVGPHGLLSDTWSFSNGTWTNLTARVTGSPGGWAVISIAYDPSGHEVVLFGGETHTGVGSDYTWTYHDLVWTNLTGHTGATPPSRYLAAMATDTADSELLLYGGTINGGSTFLGDTWTFKSGTWTNITASANAPAGELLYPSASDDPGASGVLVYGLYLGAGDVVAVGTLLFSAGSWSNLSAQTSGDSANMVLTTGGYLAPIGAATFVSTILYNASGEVLPGYAAAEWANDTWTNVTPLAGGPPTIGEIAGVSDLPGDQGLIAFGGEANLTTFVGPTWLLIAPLTLHASVQRAAIDVGFTDRFTSTVAGGYGAITYHWSFGDGASAGNASPSHSYAHPGEYQVNLTVTDLVGHSANVSLNVFVVGPLEAASSADPAPATAGTPVALVGTVSGGLPPFAYNWTLGDSGSDASSAESLAHVYSKAGNYTVTFRVTDALGATAMVVFILDVEAAHTSSSANSSSSGSSSVSLTSGTGLYLLLGIVLLAVIAGVLAALLARRPKGPGGPPAPYASPPPSASYGGPMAPPPSGPPPPP
jgi:hypothetical protein